MVVGRQLAHLDAVGRAHVEAFAEHQYHADAVAERADQGDRLSVVGESRVTFAGAPVGAQTIREPRSIFASNSVSPVRVLISRK